MSLDETVRSNSRRRCRRASEPARSPSKPRSKSTTSLTSSSIETLDSSCFRSSGDDTGLNYSDMCGQMCDICNQSSPETMCAECESCMCVQCLKIHAAQYGHHGLVEITDKSGILTVHNEKKRPTDVCLCSSSGQSDIYCTNHVTFCCRQCEAKNHSDCSTISVEKLLIDTDIPKLKTTTSNLLKENLRKFLCYAQGNKKEELRKHRDVILRKATKYMQELIQVITSKLDLFTNELESVLNDNLKLLKQCERHIHNLQLDIQAIEQPKPLSECEDRLAQLKVLKIIETRKLRSYSTFGAELEQCERFLDLEFHRNETFLDSLKKLSIGKLCKVSGERVSLGNGTATEDVELNETISSYKKSKSKPTLKTMCLENCNFMSCWTEGDYSSNTCITDIKTLSNNTLLVADNENKKLKLLRQISQGLEVISSVELGGEPWQLSELDSNKYIVTVLQMSTPVCMLFDVVGTRIVHLKSFDLKKECTGIVVKGNNIILCGYDGEHAYIITTDIAGAIRGEINFYGKSGLQRPNYMCLSFNELVLYVSDADRGIFGLDINDLNKVIFRYTAHVKCPLGMTLDSYGNLVVCGSQSHAIYILSKDGKLVRKIKLGYMQIQSVAVLNGTRFIISSSNLGYDLAVIPNCS